MRYGVFGRKLGRIAGVTTIYYGVLGRRFGRITGVTTMGYNFKGSSLCTHLIGAFFEGIPSGIYPISGF